MIEEACPKCGERLVRRAPPHRGGGKRLQIKNRYFLVGEGGETVIGCPGCDAELSIDQTQPAGKRLVFLPRGGTPLAS